MTERLPSLLRLIELERDAEKEENKKQLDRYPIELRESLGKTVSGLTVAGEDVGVGGLPLLILQRPEAGEDLAPFHAMDRGDIVRVSFGNESVDGTMYDVEEYRAVVALQAELAELPIGKVRVDLLGSDATHRRMKRALEDVLKAGGRLGELRDITLGLKAPESQRLPATQFFNERLNKYQRDAVIAARAAEDVALVHGPPGTGKTTVLVEIIRQACAIGHRVLASAPSNVAVDNMLEKLLPTGLRVVRLGHPARTMEELRHATLAAQEAAHPERQAMADLDEARERLIKQKLRRQERGRGLRREEHKELQIEIDKLWKEARYLERQIAKRILADAQVVLATHGGIGTRVGGPFDLVVLDEASQSTEPLSWIPIVHGKKVVIAGDPLQLPPTIYSKPAAEQGLALTLMERLMPVVPEKMKTLLRVQYRMHETIMGFSSKMFYEDKLEAHETVRSHLAKDLPGVTETDLTAVPLVYVDTAGAGFDEAWNELLDSRENEGEAQLALRLFEHLRAAGIEPRQAAIITPYAAQSRLLKRVAPKGLEVGTVDGFQGREKEVVLVSLVRSNPEGEVGFLSDTRRMNVAMTRARRLLIVIGDSATIGRHKFYEQFLEYAEKHEAHRSSYEFPA